MERHVTPPGNLVPINDRRSKQEGTYSRFVCRMVSSARSSPRPLNLITARLTAERKSAVPGSAMDQYLLLPTSLPELGLWCCPDGNGPHPQCAPVKARPPKKVKPAERNTEMWLAGGDPKDWCADALQQRESEFPITGYARVRHTQTETI